jgi:hypothetical protein
MTINPHLRDSDELLIATMWYHEARLSEGNRSAVDLLNKFINGDLSSAESIRRSRQKIQQDFPELRGQAYKKRQGKLKEETLKELGY